MGCITMKNHHLWENMYGFFFQAPEAVANLSSLYLPYVGMSCSEKSCWVAANFVRKKSSPLGFTKGN